MGNGDKEYKDKVLIGGKEYACEVIDGVRYIDGKTTDEFVRTLDIDTIRNLSVVGFCAVECEKKGVDFSAKKTLDCLETTENN